MPLPTTKMYALRHGQTGRIWRTCEGGRWLWDSPMDIKKSWDILRKAGIVTSRFEEHDVITVQLKEV